MRKTILIAGEVIFIVAGFAAGLSGAPKDPAPGAIGLVGAAIGCGIVLLVLPWLLVLLFRVNIAVGFFKPPWERPRLFRIPSRTDNILPFVQVLACVFAALGIGAAISMAWRGRQPAPTVMLAFSMAMAFHLGLTRVIAFTTGLPNASEVQEGKTEK